MVMPPASPENISEREERLSSSFAVATAVEKISSAERREVSLLAVDCVCEAIRALMRETECVKRKAAAVIVVARAGANRKALTCKAARTEERETNTEKRKAVRTPEPT